MSTPVVIRAARIPDPPSAITTKVDIPNSYPLTVDPLVITWTAEYDGGSPIIAYTILIKQNDGTFTEDMVNCAGTDQAIVLETKCLIPIQRLKDAPYSHPWGAFIYAKISATNLVGTSEYSVIGNGA
jgi:hypothetical protein